MGCAKVILCTFAVFVVFICYKVHKCLEPPPVPILDEPYWGPGKEPVNYNKAIRKINIKVPDKILQDLKHRLENHRPFTPPLEGAAQHYGFNTNLLKEIVDFWKNEYDWREREKIINKYPHYKTVIQGLDIHFIHVKPSNPEGLKVLPLLLLHGWPGSFMEFYQFIPLLTEKRDGYDFVFELIVPSLPGYGFSSGAAKKGLGSAQAAVVFKNLMERLGFEKWYGQGGDFGAIVLSHMAALFEDKFLGLHMNMCHSFAPKSFIKLLIGSLYPPLVVEKENEDRVYPLSKHFKDILIETGYFHLQATKPDTIGGALDDSPVGLAAYILEKVIVGTNDTWRNRDDGGLKLKYTYEELLDNVMVYWVTHSKTTAARFYAESFNSAQMQMGMDRIPIKVPTACAKFKVEFYQPDSILRDRYVNLMQSTHFDEGGHFAAFENPRLLADDVFLAVDKMEKSKNN